MLTSYDAATSLDLDAAGAVLTLILSLISLAGLIVAGIRWVVKRQLEEIRDNTRELRRNSGSHLADAIARIDETTERTERGLAQHIADHRRFHPSAWNEADDVLSARPARRRAGLVERLAEALRR